MASFFFELQLPSDIEDTELSIHEAVPAGTEQAGNLRKMFLKKEGESDSDGDESAARPMRSAKQKEIDEISRRKQLWPELIEGARWKEIEEHLGRLAKIAAHETDHETVFALTATLEPLDAVFSQKKAKAGKTYTAAQKKFKALYKKIEERKTEKKRIQAELEQAMAEMKTQESEENIREQAEEILIRRRRALTSPDDALAQLAALEGCSLEERIYIGLGIVACTLDKAGSTDNKYEAVQMLDGCIDRILDSVGQMCSSLEVDACEALMASVYQRISAELLRKENKEIFDAYTCEASGKVTRLHREIGRWLEREGTLEQRQAAAIRWLEFLSQRESADRSSACLDDALSLFQLLKQSPEHRDLAGLLYALSLFCNNEFDAGMAVFRQCSETAAKDPQTTVQAGLCAFRAGRFNDAVQLLGQAAEEKPGLSRENEYVLVLASFLAGKENKHLPFITGQRSAFFFDDRNKALLCRFSRCVSSGDVDLAMQLLSKMHFIGMQGREAPALQHAIRCVMLKVFLSAKNLFARVSVAKLNSMFGLDCAEAVAAEIIADGLVYAEIVGGCVVFDLSREFTQNSSPALCAVLQHAAATLERCSFR